MAVKHGKATKVYDRSKVSFERFTKTGDRCASSDQYVPDDSEKYPMCDNMAMRSMGEGFPILFQLMKYLFWLMGLQTIFMAGPMLLCIMQSFSVYGDPMTLDEDSAYQWSFGALLKYMEPDDTFKHFAERRDLIVGYTGALFFGNIISFFIYRVLRRKLKNDIAKIDSMTSTPSDFCIMGQCEEFSRDCNYSQEQIEQEIKSYFYEKYEINDIEYVNVSYNVQALYGLYEEERAILKKMDLIKWYCK